MLEASLPIVWVGTRRLQAGGAIGVNRMEYAADTDPI